MPSSLEIVLKTISQKFVKSFEEVAVTDEGILTGISCVSGSQYPEFYSTFIVQLQVENGLFDLLQKPLPLLYF